MSRLGWKCPTCGKRLKAEASVAGRKVRCPGCGTESLAPGAKAPPSRAPVPTFDDPVEPFRFAARHRVLDDELDMTPMIDIVFQLLIFFMVTATWDLQKAIELPTPEPRQTAGVPEPEPTWFDDPDVVVVEIDEDSTLWVANSVAPSPQELIARLRAARRGTPGGGPGARRLVVLAHPACRHEAVVQALDAGSAAAMDEIRLATQGDDP